MAELVAARRVVVEEAVGAVAPDSQEPIPDTLHRKVLPQVRLDSLPVDRRDLHLEFPHLVDLGP